MAVSMNHSEIELTRLEDDDASNQEYQSLPRADGGRQAWLFLAACFMIEAMVWGFPFAFGVFQVYYSNQEQFSAQSTGIAAIGTTATGVMYFLSPVTAVVLQRWPKIRRPAMFTGLAVMLISLISASFCDNVPSLIATQGVMYALGGVWLYFPVMQMVDEWFIVRKGLAFGVMWGGTGCAGIAVPFLIQWLLDGYGFRTALRTWTIIVAAVTIPCLPFLKPRLPVAASGAFKPIEWSFLAHPAFWLFEIGNIGQSLGYFLPGLYIPSFADSLGMPTFAGPLALALYNIAFCIGSILLGTLIDRYHVTSAILVCTLGSMVANFIFWGLTTSQPMLYAFAILFGVFGGSFSVTWSGCANALRRSEGNNNIDAGLIISLLAAGKGIGAVISGPLSAALLQSTWQGHAEFAYGSGYGPLVVFSGISAALGGTAWIGRQFRLV